MVSEAAKFYLDKILLPITPEKLTIKNKNKNEEIELADGRPATIAKFDGAQTFEFEFRITNEPDSFVFSDALQPIRFYTDWLWQKKYDREKVTLTITRSNGVHTCVNALLDDYSYAEDAEDGSDYRFTVSFTEYHDWRNQELDTDIEHHLINVKAARGWHKKK